jgi:hypothetical protein
MTETMRGCERVRGEKSINHERECFFKFCKLPSEFPISIERLETPEIMEISATASDFRETYTANNTQTGCWVSPEVFTFVSSPLAGSILKEDS